MVRIGLFGGSFNPIHNGHLIVARSVAERLGIARLILVPAAVPPHKLTADLAPPEHRLEMLRLAVQSEGLFEVSDFELRQPGPSYTVLTVAEFRRRLGPGTDLCWIIGADSLPDLVNWYQADRLVEMAAVVTAARPGWEDPDLSVLAARFTSAQLERLRANVLGTPRIDISSSEIRRRVAQGLSIRYLTPEAVVAYIQRHGLYRPLGDREQAAGRAP